VVIEPNQRCVLRKETYDAGEKRDAGKWVMWVQTPKSTRQICMMIIYIITISGNESKNEMEREASHSAHQHALTANVSNLLTSRMTSKQQIVLAAGIYSQNFTRY